MSSWNKCNFFNYENKKNYTAHDKQKSQKKYTISYCLTGLALPSVYDLTASLIVLIIPVLNPVSTSWTLEALRSSFPMHFANV